MGVTGHISPSLAPRPARPVIGAVTLALGLIASVGGASAQSLAEEQDINTGLFYMAVADEIRKRCDSIVPRFFHSLGYMHSLKDLALERGYTRDEIERYVSDKDEKRKIRRRSDDYIRAQGAKPNDGPSLCRLGRDEIAKGSPIGQFLKER